MASKKVILCPNPFRDERLAAAKRSKEILENVGLQTVVCLPFNREGYGEELAAVPVRFTVQPQPERMVRTEIAGQRAFVFDRFILVVERANFTAAGANLRLRVTPRNVKGLSDFSSDLWFEILPDGQEADNGFMQTRYLSEGSIVVEVLARAGSELPKFVRILPTTDDGRPLPQYAADVRLRVVEY